MQAYVTIYTTALKEYLAYRLNFVLWRFRMVLATLVSTFVWLAVFENRQSFGHYSQERSFRIFCIPVLSLPLLQARALAN